jgi:integrase
MSISRRTLSGGEVRYDVRVRISGRVVTRSFRRRRDADAYLVRVESDRLDGLLVDPRRRRIPFRTVAEQWLANDPHKRETSRARDRSIIQNHLEPAFGARLVGTITRSDVQNAVDRWSSRQAPSTVGRQFSCLRAIFAFAESNDLVTRSPCWDIHRPRVQLVQRPDLSIDQLSDLADALGHGHRTFMWCGAVLGLRWSETAGLSTTDIAPERGTVSVSGQLSRSGMIVPPKTDAAHRTMTCPEWLLKELVNLIETTDDSKVRRPTLVFTNDDGGPLSYPNWRSRLWQPSCSSAGLPGLRYHDLRSHAATALITAGVDVKTAQVRLGHSSPQTTLGIYARATRESDRRAAALVGELLRPRDKRAIGHLSPDAEKSPVGLPPGTSRVGARGLEPPTSAV